MAHQGERRRYRAVGVDIDGLHAPAVDHDLAALGAGGGRRGMPRGGGGRRGHQVAADENEAGGWVVNTPMSCQQSLQRLLGALRPDFKQCSREPALPDDLV